MKKVIAIAVGILLVSLMGYKLYNNKKYIVAKATPQNIEKNVSVETIKVKRKEFKTEMFLTGTFAANKEVNVLSETNGKIITLTVNDGDFVPVGKVIAQVDKDIISAQLATAEAQLEKLQKDMQRMENLVKSGAITDVQYQEVKLGLKSAESNVKILKKQLSNTTIVAPFSGVISKKMVEQGSVITPGAPVCTITDISKVKLNVMMPEVAVVKVIEGKKVPVTVDAYDNYKLEGVISLIPVKTNASQLYPVEVTVVNPMKNNTIRAGMFGRIVVSDDKERNSLYIPRLALVGSVKDPKVFVVENGKVVLKNLKVIESEGDDLEIISGLSENEEVVMNGQINLSNNTKVTVTKSM